MASDVPDIALSTLANFISTNIPALTVKQEWPYANEPLKFPSLTISTNEPKRTPIMPVLLSQTAPDVNHKITITEAVAWWDDTFQLDLWTRNKAERRDFTDQIIALFNSQMSVTGNDGLALPMTDHFNELCSYEITTIKCVDDEAAAQRQERREMIKVIINCRELRQRVVYAMVNIVGKIGGFDQPVLTDDIVDTDTVNFT